MIAGESKSTPPGAMMPSVAAPNLALNIGNCVPTPVNITLGLRALMRDCSVISMVSGGYE
ncbi:hypothetical protein D3C80_2230270 [compost metagenome]